MLAPPPEFEAAADEAFQAVVSLAEETFGPEVRVLAFGSLVQGAHLKGSDLDLSIDMPGEPLEGNAAQVAALRRLLAKLRKTFRVVETRLFKHIKVPIVIVSYTSRDGQEIEADISMGIEFAGLRKDFTDRLVRKALDDAPVVLHVLRIVKTWAKLEKLNKAYEGYLNSLGWTLLVLYYFMQTGDIASGIIRENADEVAAQDCCGMLDVPVRNDSDIDRALCQEHVMNFFDWVVATASEWPEHPEGGAYGISLVEGSMIEVPPPSKQWPDQCTFFLEDPGIRIRRGEIQNVARSLQTGPWRSSLERCENAARSLKELAADDKSWSGQSEDALDAWLSSLEQIPEVKWSIPAPVKAVQNWTPAPKKRALDWPAPAAEPFAKRRRTEDICQWFLKNECWSGDRCKKSHAV
eukprot:TRINITY_DN11067_c0_g1_i1.p1 TRINITY_DN11067_c0_g1~~TRINITY_DN11067_c0_g1_i1.p1  ORF type:complete len:408 (-),score=86.62 TRINITY_DN11067_c0_g1_i1:132-1355(-)